MKRQNIIYTALVCLLITILTVNAYLYKTNVQAEGSFETISAEKAHDLITKNKGGSDLVVLDIRAPSEYAGGHIENSINVDYCSDDFRNRLGELDKDKKYIVHCRSGARTTHALPVMEELGFKNVLNLQGIIQWKEAGYSTVSDE